jgi:quercetin dioxygenase-like cupin family protein
MKKLIHNAVCVLFATFALFFLTDSALAQDAAKVDPDHYKVEFENDQVRIIRITYAPGEKSVMHEHPDGVVVFLTGGGETTMHLPDGTSIKTTSEKGQASWAPAGKHLPENTSDKPVEAILIELKGHSTMAIKEAD